MTPKQKLKKLQEKDQFKNTRGYKKNKHRNQVGITLEQRSERRASRTPRMSSDYNIYGNALALHMLGKIIKKEIKGE